VNVVVHSHPCYASVFSAADEPLEPYTLDADYLLDVPRQEADVALITTKDEGADLARALGSGFAVLIANHGVTFCGTTIEHAVCAGVFLEKACKAHIIGRGSGVKTSMPNRAVREKRNRQIMTPAHWEHCWNYFCRKLEDRTRQSGSEAIFS
jgi:ribulose-5-phosphate 4-epimerase/fuculose-1-phosphate aldolase